MKTDSSLRNQTVSFKEQLGRYQWYDPILILVKNLHYQAPDYRENGLKPSVTPCGHMLHYRCMQSLLQSSNQHLERSKSVFCPVCRRLERGIIPVLTRLLVNVQWRERVQQISWTDQCQNKGEFQACLKDMIQCDNTTKWWVSEEMIKLIEEVEQENDKSLLKTAMMFNEQHSNEVELIYSVYL